MQNFEKVLCCIVTMFLWLEHEITGFHFLGSILIFYTKSWYLLSCFCVDWLVEFTYLHLLTYIHMLKFPFLLDLRLAGVWYDVCVQGCSWPHGNMWHLRHSILIRNLLSQHVIIAMCIHIGHTTCFHMINTLYSLTWMQFHYHMVMTDFVFEFAILSTLSPKA